MTNPDDRSSDGVSWIDATWVSAGPFFSSDMDDATLRDLYAPPMDRVDWDAFLRALPGPWTVVFTIDGEPRDRLPTSIAEIEVILRTAAPSLSIDVGGPIAICHFFATWDTKDDTELVDFAAREVAGEPELIRVMAFLRWLGTLLRRPVWMTFEARDVPIIRWDPGSDRILVRQPIAHWEDA